MPLLARLLPWLGWLLSLTLSAPPTMGCVGSPGDRWFDETLTLHDVVVAPGVEFHPDPSSPHALAITNTTATPLYLLRPADSNVPLPSPAPSLLLPEPLRADVRIVDNAVAVRAADGLWQPIGDVKGYEWSQSGEGAHTFVLRSLGLFMPNLAHNPVVGDKRPAGVAVPPPDQFEL